MVTRSAQFLSMVLILAACPPRTSGAPARREGDKIVFSGDQKSDWGQIVSLENEAKALVKSDGCSSSGECRTAPVGSRACGGPRYYLVYCSRTTDSAALFRKLEAVAAAEREYNVKYRIMSTCIFRLPPQIPFSGGSCRMTEGAGPGLQTVRDQ